MDVYNNNDLEFKALGFKIETLSIMYGTFLILLGLIASLLSNSGSFTSYIPSILGIPILIFSYLSTKFENKKKLFMHIVVLFGLITFLGGLDFIRSLINGSSFDNIWADTTKLIMLITSIFFLYFCIKSFIHARKNNNLKS